MKHHIYIPCTNFCQLMGELEHPSDHHVCDYHAYKDMVFACGTCGKIHKCGSETCEHLFFNSDFTSVCRLTGLCFEQRQCETFIDASKGMAHVEDHSYYPKIKRDQQLKNRSVNVYFITDMISKISICEDFTKDTITSLIGQIYNLWGEFVSNSIKEKMYIHRKDRRCFVVAIMFSLYNGIYASSGCVVRCHKKYDLRKINKKKVYESFKVSDIRYGQKMIMRAFQHKKAVNIVHIC